MTYEEETVTLTLPEPNEDAAYDKMITDLLQELDDLARLEAQRKAKVLEAKLLDVIMDGKSILQSTVDARPSMMMELQSALTKHKKGQYLKRADDEQVALQRHLSIQEHRQRILQQPWPSMLHRIRTREYTLKHVEEAYIPPVVKQDIAQAALVSESTQHESNVPASGASSRGRCTLL